MPALHAPATVATAADVDGELPHRHARDRNLFLILQRYTRFVYRSSAGGTLGRQGRVVPFINPARVSASTFRPVPSARFPAGAFRIPRQRLGKRRRLATSGPPGRLEFVLQSINPPLQAIILALELIPLALGPLRALSPPWIFSLILRRRGRQLRHAAVMPESAAQYKINPLNSYGYFSCGRRATFSQNRHGLLL
jgi:hypothetical protein